MAKALAAAPLAARKRRRETDTDGDLPFSAARLLGDCFCGWLISLEPMSVKEVVNDRFSLRREQRNG
jgi:hypothetical protein